MKKRNNKGFTLAELLIVVAIIAVLVAIAIPIFGAQLEKSREATDAANIRNAYAEVTTAAVSGETAASKLTKSISVKQQESGWQNSFEFPSNLNPGSTSISPGGNVTITYHPSGSKKETVTASVKLEP